MPTSPIVLGLIALTLGISLLALWKGSFAERVGGAVVGANVVLSIVSGLLLPESAQALARLTLDGLTAISLLIITVSFASFWLGGVMLLYAVQFSLHAFYIVTSRPVDVLYAWVNNLNFLGIVICLLVGAIVGWRQRLGGRSRRAAGRPGRFQKLSLAPRRDREFLRRGPHPQRGAAHL